MRFGELIPLIGALLNFSLALFVLFQNPRAVVSRVYFVLGIGLAIWNFGTFWMFRIPHDPAHYLENHDKALYWARFLQFGVILIPFTLFHLSFLIAQIRIARRILWFAYGFHALLFFSNFTKFFIKDVREVNYGTGGNAWYCEAGTGFWIFVGVFSLMPVSVAVLIWHRRNVPPLSKRRITPLIIAQAAIACFGCNDALPILGIDTYLPNTDYQIYPFGSMAAIFYGVIVGYSVLQYQLLEVRVTLNSSTAKAVRVLFIFLTGLCTQLVFWLGARDVRWFHGQEPFNYYSFFAGLATLMIGAVCAALLFPRLFGESSEAVERHILGDTFEGQDQARKFIETITWYTDLPTLFTDLHDLLTRVFQLDGYQLVLRNETNQLFELTRSHPQQPARTIPELKPHSATFRYFDWAKREYLPLEDDDLYTRSTLVAQQAREELASLAGRFCFPMSSEGEIFGLLLVGDKTAEQFTANDISLLIALVKSLSLVVNQIRLKMQVQQAMELELLGKMSRGMAHDLNNLLTPVWTLLQLSSENDTPKPLDLELLPVALRNVSTMRSYIKEALFFSENLRPDLQFGRLDLVIHQASVLAKASRKKEVEVVPETPVEALVEMDEVLIQRLIANLISNSIDASPSGAQIRVHLEKLAKSEATREWWRVRVIDQGEGIPKENLGRILTPYFTTKNRGDENRGFGLGLAICRKIIHLHGGQLNITSQPKKGTTVQFDLPSRQNKAAPQPIAENAA